MKFANIALTAAAPLALAAAPAMSPVRAQWPAGSTGKIDIPAPGSSFDPDVSSMSLRCLWAGWTVSSRFDTSCFQNNKSLYFSAPGQICTPKCLDTTVELAKYMVERCGLDASANDAEPVGYKHKNVVYLSWADKDLAHLVCNGPPSDGSGKEDGQWSDPGRCYSAVFAAESVRESGLMASDDKPDKTIMCNACTKAWAGAIKASKHRISPLLYYGHIPDAARLAAWISEQCDYRLTPI
ncbi:hypothetical protein H4R19_003132 [Coemansia spiralis]|nr:hypothetical protein H4R19_003132 [Coemansia spiralis]